MGFILQGENDYDAIRYALGLEQDSGRLLTSQIIDSFSALPMAELEARSRYTPPNQDTDVLSTLLARDLMDPSLNALKGGVCLLTCSFLCARLENTIPIETDLDQVGSIKRNPIKWLEKEKQFLSKANWFFGLIDQSLAPHRFPTVLSHGSGHIYRNDPKYYQDAWGFSSDLSGYSGIGYLYGFTYNV